MFDEFEAIGSEKIREVLRGGEFSDPSELEDALIEIRNAQQEIEHVKALKKRRAAHYDAQIKEMEQREVTLREAIEKCMTSAGKKTLKYPGVGNLSRRTVKGKWEIEDENALIEHCEELGIGDDAYEQVYKINKTKMNKVLDELEKNNNVPKGVTKGDDRESLTVTIEKDKDGQPAAKKESNVEPKAVFSGSKDEDYDGIDI